MKYRKSKDKKVSPSEAHCKIKDEKRKSAKSKLEFSQERNAFHSMIEKSREYTQIHEKHNIEMGMKTQRRLISAHPKPVRCIPVSEYTTHTQDVGLPADIREATSKLPHL